MARLKSEHLVFLVALAIFLPLVPLILNLWIPMGDEPHYLLMAHSLVYDHDIDLLNNYNQRAYAAFYPFPYLDPHVKLTNWGQVILNHDLGLPFVIAPAYALGGRAGVAIFGAFIGAMLAMQIFLLAREMTGNPPLATFTAFALMLSPPLIFYVYLVYPELLAALIIIWTIRNLLRVNEFPISNFRFIALAIALAMLPWISFRYAPLVALIALYGVFQWRAHSKRAALFSAIVGLGFAFYFLVNLVLFAGNAPAGNPNSNLGASLLSVTWIDVVRGLVGWWLDQQRGILFLAPLYLLALAGIPRLLKQNRIRGLALLLPLLILSLLIASLGGFWIAWEMGARYFVIVLPLLAAPLALALQHGLARRDFVFYPLAALAFGLSLAHATIFILAPIKAYNASIINLYQEALHQDLMVYFPELGQRVIADANNALTNAQVVAGENGNEWRAARGQSVVIASRELKELTAGNYDLRVEASAVNLVDMNANVLALDIFSAEGVLIAHTEFNARDLDAQKILNFDNPYSDYWNAPLTLQATATGQADLTVKDFIFEPDTIQAWTRIALWAGICLALIAWLNRDLIFSEA